jgi:hypothetical protein
MYTTEATTDKDDVGAVPGLPHDLVRVGPV